MKQQTKKAYSKQPLSVNEQIKKLTERGMLFSDRLRASKYLENISYYRLRAFTYPYQDNTNPNNNHSFLRNDIDFFDIIDLYLFDRRLRNLIFNGIEKIEVAVRTVLTQVYSERYNDSHWFLHKELYRETADFDKLLEEVRKEVKRSNEDFIKHYYNKYSQPEIPPSWMTLEVASFGTISRLYKNLVKGPEKRDVAKHFGTTDVEMFENWLHALSSLRNYCAHHSRIWNRRFPVSVILPYNTYKGIASKNRLRRVKQNKIFAIITVLKYMSDIISPGNSFEEQLINLLEDKHKLLSIKEMGFPDDWENFPIWSQSK